MQTKLQASRFLASAAILSLLVGCQATPTATRGLLTTSPTASNPYHVAAKASAARYVVAFKGDTLPTDLTSRLAAANGTLETSLAGMGVAIVQSSDSNFLTKMGADKTVESAGAAPSFPRLEAVYAQDFSLQADGPDASGASGEPLSGYQWGLNTTSVPPVWAKGFTGKGVRVAVLDTGVDEKNRDLKPNLDSKRSVSFVASEPTTTDYNGHGSHVAGIIGAAVNGYGVSGVAPGVSYFAVKVLDRTGSGSDADTLKGIAYAADQGAKIINMSLGGTTNDGSLINAYRHAVRYALKKGAIVVASAGNDGASPKQLGQYLYPAETPACIAVSAVGPQAQQNFDTFSLFSNYGGFIDCAAPGGNLGYDPAAGQMILYSKRDFVLSTWSTQADTWSDQGFTFKAASHMFLAGTSQAAPHVSGALALLYEAHPNYSPAQARNKLLSSTDDLGKPGEDRYYGAGRLNVARAVL